MRLGDPLEGCARFRDLGRICGFDVKIKLQQVQFDLRF